MSRRKRIHLYDWAARLNPPISLARARELAPRVEGARKAWKGLRAPWKVFEDAPDPRMTPGRPRKMNMDCEAS